MNKIYERLYIGCDYECFDEKVQEQLKSRAEKFGAYHRKGVYRTEKFLKYRGVLRCGFCDCRMTGQNQREMAKKGRPEYVAYRCTHGRKNTQHDWYRKEFGVNHSGVRMFKGKQTINCPQKMWTPEEIDEAVKRELQALSWDKEAVKEMKEALEVDFKERMSVSETQRKTLEAELKEKDNLRKALIKKMALEEHSDVAMDLQDVIKETKREMDSIRREIDSIEEVEEFKIDEITDMLILSSDLAKQYDKLNERKQRRLIMTAFKRISLRKGKVDGKTFNSIDIAWSEPFQILNDWWLKKVAKEGPDPNVPKIPGGGGGSSNPLLNVKLGNPTKSGLRTV